MNQKGEVEKVFRFFLFLRCSDPMVIRKGSRLNVG